LAVVIAVEDVGVLDALFPDHDAMVGGDDKTAFVRAPLQLDADAGAGRNPGPMSVSDAAVMLTGPDR
jgi:hypothetical protein